MRGAPLLLNALLLAAPVVGAAEAAPVPVAGPTSPQDRALQAADQTWLGGNPTAAAAAYRTLLADLTPDQEPVRGTVVLRLAQACRAAGDPAGARAALALMPRTAPEHHALAATELAAVLDGTPHPGLQPTPIPPLAADAVRIVIGGAGGVPDLAQALTQARAARQASPQRPIHLLLTPGRHPMTEALRLEAVDAGRPGAPLVIASLDPTHPATLSGTSKLTTWKPVEDSAVLAHLPEASRAQVLVADLAANGVPDLGPIILGGGHSSRRAQLGDPKRVCSFKSFPVPELLLDGTAQPMAAFPDGGKVMGMDPAKPSRDKPGYVARRLTWRGETDLWMHGYWAWDWSDAWEQVAKVNDDATIDLVPPTNLYHTRGSHGVRVVNALAELDVPGEWKIDGTAQKMYWWPPVGADPTKAELSTAIGAIRADHVPFVQIRDLRLEGFRGDALVLTDSDDALVAKVEVQATSGMALRSERGKRLLVHSCHFHNLGRNGMDLLAGDWATLERGDTVIENCVVSDISRIDRTYTPAAVLDGYGYLVRHCLFQRIPSSGIRLESGATRIELCRFQDCVQESGDQGAIDMWANPLLRGNVIRWNDFHRILGRTGGKYGAAGVRHDDFISGVMSYENLFRIGSTKGFGAMQVNKGAFNWGEGNVLLEGHALVSGEAGQVNRSHGRVNWVLAHAAWQQEPWTSTYPAVARMFERGPNYLIDNLAVGGRFGTQGGSWRFANRPIDLPVPTGDGLEGVAAHLPPWRPIPVERIGPVAP